MIVNREPNHDMLAEYVRCRLVYVFNIVANTKPEKQLQLSNIDSRDPKNFRHGFKKVSIDGSEFEIPAQEIHVTVIRTYKCSSILISDLNFNHLPWSRAVKELEDPYFSWISYCYGNKLNFDYQIIICRYIWYMFENHIKEQKKQIPEPRIQEFRSLTWLAVQCAVYKIKNDVVLYDIKTLARLKGIKERTWYNHFNPYWKLLLHFCYELDWESLTNVDRKRGSRN